MTCNSGLFFRVERRNCRNGSESSTTRTRIEDVAKKPPAALTLTRIEKASRKNRSRNRVRAKSVHFIVFWQIP